MQTKKTAGILRKQLLHNPRSQVAGTGGASSAAARWFGRELKPSIDLVGTRARVKRRALPSYWESSPSNSARTFMAENSWRRKRTIVPQCSVRGSRMLQSCRWRRHRFVMSLRCTSRATCLEATACASGGDPRDRQRSVTDRDVASSHDGSGASGRSTLRARWSCPCKREMQIAHGILIDAPRVIDSSGSLGNDGKPQTNSCKLHKCTKSCLT